jgi:formate dehydrogenase iron-sulfur subunit
MVERKVLGADTLPVEGGAGEPAGGVSAPRTSSPRMLAAELLAEQRDLTAVERFARWHEGDAQPEDTRFYKRLIPLHLPKPGQQYAFEVNLDKCSGCKSCVGACHSLNGLDEGESWRDTGLLVSDDWRHPYQQTITTACHHCVEPACLSGCPVLAYDKDPLTGIVRHLDDQCIGCQYCALKCPYEVPKYSPKRGIVRKCDMCSSRLAVGEPPACAQACPNEAIRITLVETKSLMVSFREHSAPATLTRNAPQVQTRGVELHLLPPINSFLPATPAPDYTIPTTRYITSKGIPGSVRAADHAEIHPQPSHTPLVFMLVLSQLSVGLYLFDLVLTLALPADRPRTFHGIQTLAAFGFAAAALLISGLHLGRPLGAWRAFLGLRQSWLSREIVVFGLFLPLAGLHTAASWLSGLVPTPLRIAMSLATLFAGLLGVFCSAMVYHDTRREFWRVSLTAGKFFCTTLLLGAMGTLLTLAVGRPPLPIALPLSLVGLLAVVAAVKLALEYRVVRRLADDNFSSLHKTALLLTCRFGFAHRSQVTAMLFGALFLPGPMLLKSCVGAASVAWSDVLALSFGALFALCLFGEFMERRLFFLAVQPVKMPGAIAS